MPLADNIAAQASAIYNQILDEPTREGEGVEKFALRRNRQRKTLSGGLWRAATHGQKRGAELMFASVAASPDDPMEMHLERVKRLWHQEQGRRLD